ncbi:MAG: TonB-dependent receptor, partial [Ferruginibacter sp.]|nr:TonB-dependent receptor [Ferruginibacter sp.]
DLAYTKSTKTQPGGMAPTDIIQRGISMARNFPGKFGQGQYGDAGQSNRINPVGEAEASGIFKAETPTLSMRFGFTAEVFKNFVLEGAYTNRTSYTEAYSARGTYNTFTPNPSTGNYLFQLVTGDSTLNYSNNRINTNQYYGSANYSFNIKSAHEFKMQAGFQGLDNTSKSISGTRAGLTDPNRPYFNLAVSNLQPSLAGSATDNSLAGTFGRFNYSYNQKYLLEVTGRYDASSRFSQLLNNQTEIFSGISAGWILTKEKFMENVNFLNYAKIRVSRGSIGNQEVGAASNYPFVAQLNPGTAYYFNNNISRGSSLNSLPNENIAWETSVQSNLGVDLVLLKNKLSITFDVYRKKINDLIIQLPVPTAIG